MLNTVEISGFQARWYQEEAVESVFDFYSQPRPIGPDGKPVRKNPLICLPTGTGKSLVIAMLAMRMFQRVPDTRLMMQTHVKTLIEQNGGKLLEIWPNAPLGFYSAGMKRRDCVQPIIYGGIQSCVGKYPIFGHRDFLFIDEAHLVGNEGRYLQFIAELERINPFLKIVGLSATPYRLGLGCLTNGKIFTDVVYDLCNIEGFSRLIAEGYLCPLVGKRGNFVIDVSKVKLGANGDYMPGEVSAAIKEQNKTIEQLTEFVAYGENRRSWIVFAAGIEEAEELGELLNTMFGIPTVVLHSEKSTAHNDAALKAWKAGEVRCAVNMNMLTTGVDNPYCDYMGDFAPTTSTGKHVQKCGRLTRTAIGKINGLVMDYAGNIRRLGPINDPKIPRKKGESSGGGEAPVKICNEAAPRKGCGFYNTLSATECAFCGKEFEFQDNTTRQAWDGDVLRSDLPQMDWVTVNRVVYTKHVSRAAKAAAPGVPEYLLPFTIKASYYCGIRTYYEYITLEGKGGNITGRNWFRRRFEGEPPATNREVLELSAQLRMPSKIKVWMNAQPAPRVMDAEF